MQEDERRRRRNKVKALEERSAHLMLRMEQIKKQLDYMEKDLVRVQMNLLDEMQALGIGFMEENHA